MPASLWAKMGYSDRVKQAKAKGLFDNFDKALIQAAQARFGRDCEFQSLNDMKGVDSFRYDGKDAVSTLAAHWGID